jgi:hypothetical protein
VGETIAGYPRVVRWFISYAYFRHNGGLAVGGTDTAHFVPDFCRAHLPMITR